MPSDSRLERAMELFLAFQERGVSRDDAVAQHPELAELLDLLYADDRGDDDGETATRPGDGTVPGADDGALDRDAAFGKFRIVRPLGRGGAGIVYEAYQSSLGRRVALKVLAAGSTATTTQIARFRREALTLARLDHPHVVRVLDVGSENGRHWLAMDLVDGETLADRLEELRGDDSGVRAQSLRPLVEGIAQIAGALAHAHAAGVLHRDVKPSNILVHRDGRMLLSDFGLARDDTAPSVTQAGTIVGTPNYMSPEQVVAAQSLQPTTDVFSLGATLYECVTLQRPFRGDSTEVVLRSILEHDPPDPRKLRPGLPADLAAIVLKAIEKDPARRYPTAGAMAADLRAFLDLQPVQARVPSLLQRGHRWLRREPLRGVAAAVLVAAIAAGAWMLAQQPALRAAESARVEREFEQLLGRGTARSVSKQHDEALADLRAALALRPRDSLAITCLAMALLRKGDGEHALAELASRQDTADDADLLRRARAYVLAGLGRRDEANALRAALPPPTTPAALWIVGAEHLLRAQDDQVAARQALDHLSLAVRLTPTPRLVWTVQWTFAAHKARDEAAAKECVRLLLQHWPDEPWALHCAAVAQSRSDPNAALANLLRARAAGMQAAESAMLEVFVREQLRDSAGVIAAVHRALDLQWESRNRQYLIEALDRAGDRDGFDAAASKWYREQPDDLMAMKVMATALSWREDHDASIALFGKIVERVPNDAEHLYNLAVVQHVGGRDDDALATLAKVVAIDGANARAHARLLDLLQDRGDAAGIVAEHRRWAAARMQDPAASLTLARALLDADLDPVGALAAASAANLLAGGKDPAALECLARAHERLGDTATAQSCRERAAALAAAPPKPDPTSAPAPR
jgi:tetratricopeptide (TPR) repeat protein